MTYGYFILFEPVSQHFLLMMDFGMVSDSVFFWEEDRSGGPRKRNRKYVLSK